MCFPLLSTILLLKYSFTSVIIDHHWQWKSLVPSCLQLDFYLFPVCDEGPSICAHVLTWFSIFIIFATFPLSACYVVKVAQVYYNLAGYLHVIHSFKKTSGLPSCPAIPTFSWLSVCLIFCLSVWISFWPSDCLFDFLFVCLTSISLYLAVWFSVCLFD